MQVQRRELIAVIIICFAFFLTGCAEDKALKRKQAQAKLDLGKSLLHQGNSRSGLNELLKAAELDPQKPEIQNELALAYREMEKYSEAVTHFNNAIELKPDYSEAYNNLGTVHLLRGEWDPAIHCFKTALRNNLYSTPHFAYNNLGWAYYKKSEFDAAIKSYQMAIRNQPSFSRAYHNVALTYEANNQWNKAVKSYKESIRYSPDDPRSHFFLGKLYVKLGTKDFAIQELTETIRLDKNDTYASEAKELLRKIK